MMKTLKIYLLALVSTLSFQLTANAALIPLDDLSPLHLEEFDIDFVGGISNTYTFSTDVAFDFTSSVVAGGQNVTSLTTTLNYLSGSTVGSTSATNLGGYRSSIVESMLAPGDYSFVVTVAANPNTGDSTYFGNFTIASSAAVTAVPEPQTYAMFLAGLGLLGFARRRQS